MQVLAHQFEVEALWGGLEQDVDGFAEKSDGARDDEDADEDRGCLLYTSPLVSEPA